MLSRRTHWDFTENQWSRLLSRHISTQNDYIDLTLSNPTTSGIVYPLDAIIAAIAPHVPLPYRPSPAGLPAARRAVVEFYQDRGVVVDDKQVFLTASTSEAYSHLLRLLCDPGEEVLAPSPCYPLIPHLAQLDGVGVRHYSLSYDGDWTIYWPSLIEALRPQTRAIIVVSPNNPTGNYLSASDREQLFALAESRGIAIIVDEVFADYTLSETPTPYVHFDDQCLCFGLHGLSKAIGMPQLKLSWVRVGGPNLLVHEATRRLEMILDTYLSVAAPTQEGLSALLGVGKSVQAQIKTRLQTNRAQLASLWRADAPWNPLHVEGGWTQPIRLPAILDDEQWAVSLLQYGRCVAQPGFFYEFELPAVLVVSLLVDEVSFADGLQRLDGVVRLLLS